MLSNQYVYHKLKKKLNEIKIHIHYYRMQELIYIQKLYYDIYPRIDIYHRKYY